MNTILKALAGISLATACGSVAAVPVVDTITPPQPVYVATGSPYTVTHDITDNGYTVAVDTITSAVLDIWLTDIQGGGSEKYTVVIGSNATNQTLTGSNVNSGVGIHLTPTLTIPSLADLIADGRLDLIFSAESINSSGSAGYLFSSSTLTAQVTPVPEPGLLALLVPGLIMLVAMKRRNCQA